MLDLDLSRISAETPIEQVHWFDATGSTNHEAKVYACKHDANELRSPQLFITDRQLAGRGRSGAEWWAGPGALTFSLLIVKPDMPTDQSPLVSLAVGLAISRAVEEYLPASPVRVKWPNDVFVDGLKVCGILIEAPAEAPGQLVIGVGLNVNNRVQGAPSELQQTATSMLDALSRPAEQPLDQTSVLIACLNQVAAVLEELTATPEHILHQLRDRCLLTGRRICVQRAGEEVCGICSGIGSQGELRVKTSTGEVGCFGGTVSLLG